MKTYTFHVSLPGAGKVWRKIEIAAEQTLEQLHLSIQDAFDFDNDHLYSFFLSGKAWDKKTEYSLPEGVSPYGEFFFDEEDVDFDEEIESLEASEAGLDLDTFLLEEVKQLTEDEETATQMLGVLKMILEADANQLEGFIQEFAKVTGEDVFTARLQITMLRSVWDDLSHDIQRDVRQATIESLNLKLGKEFLYLFDYGDEWRFKLRVHAINPHALEADYPLIVQSVGKAPPQYPYEDDEEELFLLDDEGADADNTTDES